MPPTPTPEVENLKTSLSMLEEHGVTPRTAPIRSSSYKLWRSCPFKFLLKERFGINLPLRKPSEALTLGNFLHLSLEADLKGHTGEAKEEFLANAVLEFANDLDDQLLMAGGSALSGEEKSTLWEMSITSRIWQEIAWKICPVDLEKYKPFSVEESFSLSVPWFVSPIRAKLDCLLYRDDRNEVWILDEKTTRFEPWMFIQTCPFQMQPKIYRIVVQHFIRAGAFEHVGVPRDAKVAGMIHHVIQKPTIKISKRTRKSKGDAFAYSEYTARTAEWFQGIGEFRGLGESRTDRQNPINISYQRFTGAAHGKHVFGALLDFDKACSRIAHPNHFPKNEQELLPMYGNDLDPYYPFYVRGTVEGMRLWVPIMKDKGFITRYREDSETEPDHVATDSEFREHHPDF